MLAPLAEWQLPVRPLHGDRNVIQLRACSLHAKFDGIRAASARSRHCDWVAIKAQIGNAQYVPLLLLLLLIANRA